MTQVLNSCVGVRQMSGASGSSGWSTVPRLVTHTSGQCRCLPGWIMEHTQAHDQAVHNLKHLLRQGRDRMLVASVPRVPCPWDCALLVLTTVGPVMPEHLLALLPTAPLFAFSSKLGSSVSAGWWLCVLESPPSAVRLERASLRSPPSAQLRPCPCPKGPRCVQCCASLLSQNSRRGLTDCLRLLDCVDLVFWWRHCVWIGHVFDNTCLYFQGFDKS